jgi:[ribosomal protein S5]-alanine N-acetyltransferase
MPGLEQLHAGHAPAVLAFELANRAYFAASISDRGDDFFAQFTDRHSALLAEQEAGICAFYVLVADDGSVLGRFNLYDFEDGTARLGYRVAQQVAGRGVATTSVRELCRIAAARHGLRTLRAATSHDNAASQKVLAKAGFVPVGPAAPADLGGKSGTWYQRDLQCLGSLPGIASQGGPETARPPSGRDCADLRAHRLGPWPFAISASWPMPATAWRPHPGSNPAAPGANQGGHFSPAPSPPIQTRRKEEEHEQPMTATALIVHATAPAGPRKIAPAQLTAGDARCRALFASSLQRSDAPGANVVAEAIRVTVQQLGADGCTGLMAQEFGDHPEPAATRMRWVRSLLADAVGLATAARQAGLRPQLGKA